MSKTKRILVLIVALCLLLAGCSGTKNGSDAHGTSNPKEKGTLNLSSYTPDTLNPLVTEYSCVRDFLYLAYEGLFIVNEDLSVTGVLAESYSASDDNKTYTIKLKKGVKFHDESAFTADDVVATLDYIRLYSPFYKDNILGVSSYKALGKYEVEINLSSPKANFASNLDFPILPSGIKPYEFTSKDFAINGTGRYKYLKTNPYVSIVLTKNTSWHKKDNVYIPEVMVRFVNDNDAMLHAFDSGETDMITTERARWGEFSYTGNFKTYEITTNKYVYIGINTQNSVFSDLKARRSLKSLIDSDDIVDTVMFSHALKADTPISSKAYFYRSDKSKNKDTDTAYLASKGALKLYILFNEEDKTKRSVAEYVQRKLSEIGIDAQLSAVDYDTYVSKVSTGDYHLYIGKVDVQRDCDIGFMFDTVINTAPNQSSDVIEITEADHTVINTSDICDFSDGKLNDIVKNLNSSKDEDSLKIAYNNLRLFYEENIPQIPLSHLNDALFVNGRIKGAVKVNLTNFYADIGGIYIE